MGSAHHNTGAGPLCLVDLAIGPNDASGMTRMTPGRFVETPDEQPLIALQDGTWLDSSGVALASQGATPDLEAAQASSDHMLEYTFGGAPTDWLPKLGLWQVTDRWSCFPGMRG